MISVDHLDNYTKIYGRDCADYMLRRLSHLIRRWVRETDIASRFGHNKFAVLLPETDIHGAIMVRERLLETIRENSFEWNAETLPISVSLGEAERSHIFDYPLPDHEDDSRLSVREEIAQLLEDADNALAVARKASPRPRMFIEYTNIPN